LAKELETKDVAIYTLFLSSVIFSMYLIGVEFHNYLAREVLGKEVNYWSIYVRDSAIFFVLSYFVFIPILCMIFIFNVLPYKYAPVFFLILFVEHITQECYKLLIIMQKMIQANVVLFVRSGLWCYAAILLMMMDDSNKTLETIFILWAFGGITGIFIFTSIIIKSKIEWKFWLREKINFRWMAKGLPVAGLILIGTLAYRGVYFFDKILIKVLAEYEIIAVYGLFLSIVSVAQSFLETGIISYYYPRLVASYNQNLKSKFIYESKKMMLHTFLFSAFLCLCMIASIKYILIFIEKDIYIQNISMFWVLVGVCFVRSSLLVPKYLIFSLRKDKINVYYQVMILFLVVTLFSILVPILSGLGAALSLLAAYIASGTVFAYLSYKEFSKYLHTI